MKTKEDCPWMYSIYTLDCGHKQEIRKTHFKEGKYRCHDCVYLKHKTEAENVGLKLLEKTNSAYKRYQFISCGHEKRVAPDQVRTGNVECKKCRKENINDILQNNQIEILSKVKNKCEILYLDCGHCQLTKYSNVLRNTIPKCKNCSFELQKEQALSEGLELLHEDQSVSLKSYFYKLPCGCTKSLRAGNVKRGVWACDVHSNWWNKPSGIYLLKLKFNDFECLKIGVATNVKSRISSYKFKEKCEVTEILYINFETYKSAINVEKELHVRLKHLNVDRDKMKLKMGSGWTECYDIASEDLLMNFLRGLTYE